MKKTETNVMKNFSENNRNSFIILATLIKRAITGNLATKPKKQFSKKQLDRTNAKGKTLESFLQSKNFYFPSPTENELIKRVDYIFSVLMLSDVDIEKEIEDIKKSLGFTTSDNSQDTNLIDWFSQKYQTRRTTELGQARIKIFTKTAQNIEELKDKIIEGFTRENDVLRKRVQGLKKRLSLLIKLQKKQLEIISQENEDLNKENKELRKENAALMEKNKKLLDVNTTLKENFLLLSEKVSRLQEENEK